MSEDGISKSLKKRGIKHMRKGSFLALLAFLTAIAGVLIAVYALLKRKADEEEYWADYEDGCCGCYEDDEDDEELADSCEACDNIPEENAQADDDAQ